MTFYATETERLNALLDRCESPIEFLLAHNLATLLFPDAERVNIVAQYPLARFRYDFLINGVRQGPLLLIECDGKDFHSSPEQIKNDALKDAAAAAADIKLMRFSGSAIFDNPMYCAQVAVDLTAREMLRKVVHQ